MPRKTMAAYQVEDQRASELLAGLHGDGPRRVKITDLRRTGALKGFRVIGHDLLKYVGTQAPPADDSPMPTSPDEIADAQKAQRVQHKGVVKQVEDFSQRELFPPEGMHP